MAKSPTRPAASRVSTRSAAATRARSACAAGRAGALIGLFAPLGLAGLFAAAPRPRSRRPQQTVTPLAARLGLALQLRDSPEALLAALAAGSGPALVCWRHDDMPAIAAALLGDPGAPPAWPDDCFDWVWRFEQNQGRWHLTQQPQRLLAGDASAPIT